MKIIKPIDIAHFFAIGINYKKADAGIRGQFAICNEGYQRILELAPAYNIDSLFVLSTCNRTEIYGFAPNSSLLIDLLCTQTRGDNKTFTNLAYAKNGAKAVEHLFNVGAGLDSQVLGDYEITGQLKQAVKLSKANGMLNSFLERLVNNVLQSSKTVKNETKLSGGTVSVSFAAIQYIKSHVEINHATKILLVGTGKIGRNTCKNLVDYLKTSNITLINRSEDKAAQLAAELGVKCAPLDVLDDHIKTSDIILVASNACEPVVLASQLVNCGKKLIIDLSVPYNVEESASTLPNITLINIDMLSKLNDETLKSREAEKPKAQEIIASQMDGFIDWYMMSKNAPALKAIKTTLSQIYQQQSTGLTRNSVFPMFVDEKKIQCVVKMAANKMRRDNLQGCYYLEAINEFIATA